MSGPARAGRLDLLLESIAYGFLHTYEVVRPPVPILQMLERPPAGMERDLNLCLGLPYGDAAYIRLLSGQGIVFVNPELPAPRQRFASARELLRGLLYSPRGQALGLESLADRISDGADEYFARCLLMPATLFPPRWDTMMTVALADFFGVPGDMIAARLAELGRG